MNTTAVTHHEEVAHVFSVVYHFFSRFSVSLLQKAKKNTFIGELAFDL